MLAGHGLRQIVQLLEIDFRYRKGSKNLIIEHLMEKNDIDKLANAWIELNKVNQSSREYDNLFWAFEQMAELISNKPDLAWIVVLRIFEIDKSDSTFMNLSAGPIEDLLVYHGDDFIERIEKQAKLDSQFADLLGGVWQNTISDVNWNRIIKARKSKW